MLKYKLYRVTHYGCGINPHIDEPVAVHPTKDGIYSALAHDMAFHVYICGHIKPAEDALKAAKPFEAKLLKALQSERNFNTPIRCKYAEYPTDGHIWRHGDIIGFDNGDIHAAVFFITY